MSLFRLLELQKTFPMPQSTSKGENLRFYKDLKTRPFWLCSRQKWRNCVIFAFFQAPFHALRMHVYSILSSDMTSYNLLECF